jgi:hypothetical protein
LPAIADRWIEVEESTMTMCVERILSEIYLGVMARNPTLAEELLELPAVHVSQCARLT